MIEICSIIRTQPRVVKRKIGATGVTQICEITGQICGEVGERQVDGAEIGLTHTLGGLSHAEGVACGVNVLKKGW